VSGRPRRPEPGTEDRIRELNGLLSDLRTETRSAVRVLAEIRDLTGRAALEHADVLNDEFSVISARLGERSDKTVAHMQTMVDKATDHLSRLIGAEDGRALMRAIITEASRSLADQLMIAVDKGRGVPVVMARPDAQYVDIDQDGDVKEHLRRDRDTGRVFVVTDPRDAPPGSVVLDSRRKGAGGA